MQKEVIGNSANSAACIQEEAVGNSANSAACMQEGAVGTASSNENSRDALVQGWSNLKQTVNLVTNQCTLNGAVRCR